MSGDTASTVTNPRIAEPSATPMPALPRRVPPRSAAFRRVPPRSAPFRPVQET